MMYAVAILITVGIYILMKEGKKVVVDITPNQIGYIDAIIRRKAEAYGHDPKLIKAIVKVESDYDVGAEGGIGEIGLMQISPICLQEYNNVTGLVLTAWNLHDPITNLEIGCWYLHRLQKHYGLDLWTSVRAYNCGMKNPNREICYQYENRVRDALRRIP